jgi:hypothetical protein
LAAQTADKQQHRHLSEVHIIPGMLRCPSFIPAPRLCGEAAQQRAGLGTARAARLP